MTEDHTEVSSTEEQPVIVEEPKPLARDEGAGILLLKIVLVAWMLTYLSAALILLANTWLKTNHVFCQVFGVPDCGAISPLFISGLHAVLGGVLGAGALGLVSFHRHVSEIPEFDPAHAWGYLFAPWLAGVLGLIVFALLQTGLLVFSGGVSASEDAALSNLAFLAIGFLSGFGWYDATQRIRRVVKRIFEDAEAQEEDVGEGARIDEPESVEETISGEAQPAVDEDEG